MKAVTPYVKDAGASWVKALIVALYALVFVALFTGTFDRPRLSASEADASGRPPNTAFPRLTLAVDALQIEPESADGSGGVTAGGEEQLLPGDILLGRCKLSLVPSLNPHNGWTHAALYAGGDELIVAGNPDTGVMERHVASWAYPEMTWVVYVRVAGADDETRRRAVEFARDKVGQPYDLNWLGKQENGDSWYCSELVWAAYLHASGGRIDLARGPGWFGISPDDIFMHGETAAVGGHFESRPDTAWSLLLKAFAICILAGGGGVLAPHPLFSWRRRRRR